MLAVSAGNVASFYMSFVLGMVNFKTYIYFVYDKMCYRRDGNQQYLYGKIGNNNMTCQTEFIPAQMKP